MARGWILLGASLSLGTAPYQCKSDDPARAREDTAGESLMQLCGRFAAKGDDAAARATLDYLMERYPSSRMSVRAKEERDAQHPCASVAAEASAKASAASASAKK